jgi:hypothetical protein
MIKRTKTKWKPKGIIFAVAEQSKEWPAIESHLHLLTDAEKIATKRVTDGILEGIEFIRRGFSFAVFNSLLWEPERQAEFWFYVRDQETPESDLQDIMEHFSTLLD